MKGFCKMLGLLIIIICLSACSNPFNQSSISKDDSIKSFDKKIYYLMKKYDVPGTSIAIIQNGKIVFKKGYGYANKEQRIPATEKTIFRIGSISKPVTAIGIMKLVEEGKLELDVPIEKYLTRWHIPSSEFNSDGVTVRRLLSHTSGFNIQGYPLYASGKPVPSIEQSISGIAGEQWRVTLKNEPGSTFYYSTGGYAVLQLLVEEVTGEKFEDYMKRAIFDPLGLKYTGYESSVWYKKSVATGYTGTGKVIGDRVFVDYAGAALMTTSEELAKIVQACLGSNDVDRILKEETFNIMFKPAANTKNMFGHYGLGFVIQNLSNGQKVITHSGDIVGWNAQMTFIPKNKDAIVILTNGDAGYHFKSDLLGIWSMWVAGGINNDTKFLLNMKRVTISLFLIFLLVLIILIANTYIRIRKGNRIICLSANNGNWKRWIFSLLSIFGIFLWLFIFYSHIPFKVIFGLDNYELYTFFTPEFVYITVMIILFGLYIIIKSIFTQKVKSA